MPGVNDRLDQLLREAFGVNNPNARLDQEIREAFYSANPSDRLDQIVRESFLKNNPNDRISQEAREAWLPLLNPNARLSQISREGFYAGNPNDRVDQLVREAWVPLPAGETSSAAKYYLGLLTSQYQNSPKLLAWLGAVLAPWMDALGYAQQAYLSFDIDNAVGVQLDVLGQLIGQSRVISYNPIPISSIVVTNVGPLVDVSVTLTESGLIFAGNSVVLEGLTNAAALNGVEMDNVNVTGAVVEQEISGVTISNYSGPETGTVTVASPPLDDATYRIVLKAKIAKNGWDGQIRSMYAIWSALFPGGQIIVQDNQNMTASIFLTGSFSAVIQSLIVNDYIIPRPQAVEYLFSFGGLPAFGFDRNDAFIAGFDVGKWS